MSLKVEQHPRAPPHQGRVEFGRSSRASSPCYLFPEIEICRYKVLREPEMHTHKHMFHTSTHLARREAKKLKIMRAKDKKITKQAPPKLKLRTLPALFAQVVHMELARKSNSWQLWHPQPRSRFLAPTLHCPHAILFFRQPDGGQNPEIPPTYWCSCGNEGAFAFEGRRSEESTGFAMTAVTGTTGRPRLWTRCSNIPGLKDSRLDYARN